MVLHLHMTIVLRLEGSLISEQSIGASASVPDCTDSQFGVVPLSTAVLVAVVLPSPRRRSASGLWAAEASRGTI